MLLGFEQAAERRRAHREDERVRRAGDRRAAGHDHVGVAARVQQVPQLLPQHSGAWRGDAEARRRRGAVLPIRHHHGHKRLGVVPRPGVLPPQTRTRPSALREHEWR